MRQSYYGSFREFAIVMKKLQKGQTVMFHKPYPSGGNPVAFYLGRLTRKGLLNRRSFPAHTEFRLKDGQKLTHDKQPYSKSNSACTFVEKRKHQQQPVLGINQSIVIDSFDAELG